jgi:hypothetical protein
MALALYLVAPYTELEKGRARAAESILANYAILSVFKQFLLAKRNRKWGLMSLAIATFLAALLDIATSGLIESRNVIVSTFHWDCTITFSFLQYQMTSSVPVHLTASLGIVPSNDGINDTDGNHIFMSSTEYFAAALFVGGQLHQLNPLQSPVAYAYSGPEGHWSITPFIFPNDVLPGYNPSVIANITVAAFGINTSANCKMAQDIIFSDNGSMAATADGCSFHFYATDPTFIRQYFAGSARCNNASSDIAFKAFVFGVFRPAAYITRDPSLFLVMFCQPTITISKLSATLSVSPNGVGPLLEPPVVLESFAVGSNTSDLDVRNLLGPPLNGMAVNGYDIAEPEVGISSADSRYIRANMTDSILQEGIYAAVLFHMDLEDLNSTNNWCTCSQNCESFATLLTSCWYRWPVNASNRVKLEDIVSDFYQAYLNTFAQNLYYNSSASATAIGTLSIPLSRAKVSNVHAILLGVLLFLLAILISVTLHQQPSPGIAALRMYSSTISTHVMVTTLPFLNMVSPLFGMTEKNIKSHLESWRFSFDHTGRIVVEEEMQHSSVWLWKNMLPKFAHGLMRSGGIGPHIYTRLRISLES